MKDYSLNSLSNKSKLLQGERSNAYFYSIKKNAPNLYNRFLHIGNGDIVKGFYTYNTNAEKYYQFVLDLINAYEEIDSIEIKRKLNEEFCLCYHQKPFTEIKTSSYRYIVTALKFVTLKNYGSNHTMKVSTYDKMQRLYENQFLQSEIKKFYERYK